MSRDDDRSWNDDDRPSWREIDKRRDRSSYGQERSSGSSGARSRKQQAGDKNTALRAANKLFKQKKDPQRAKAEEELAQAKGTPDFAQKAQEFIDAYGFANDWDINLLLTETPLSKIAVPAIEALAEQSKTSGDSEKRAITSKLRILSMTGKSKVKMAAKAALAKLE